MELAVCQTPEEFLRLTQDELVKREAANNLMLGLALRILKLPRRFPRQPFLAAASDESGLAAAALMTPPQNLVLHAAQDEAGPALGLLAGELHAHGWPVPGVVGPPGASRAFAGLWTQLTGLPHRLSMAQGIFELRQVVPPRWAPGRLRAAGAADVEVVAEWASAFQQEALFQTPDPLEVRELVELRIGDGDVFVWDNAQPVSMAFRARPTLNGISIGSVYTPPERRGKGYASACVAALSQLCLDSGRQFCMLYTDLSNPTSNSIYPKIGYRPIGESREHRFGDAG